MLLEGFSSPWGTVLPLKTAQQGRALAGSCGELVLGCMAVKEPLCVMAKIHPEPSSVQNEHHFVYKRGDSQQFGQRPPPAVGFLAVPS